MSRIRHTPADEAFFLIRSLAAVGSRTADMRRHVHAWGQLAYCASGVMTVWTEDGSWVAPPHWAVWIPAGVSHRLRFAGEAALRTLYLRADVAEPLPADCAVMAVSPLARELVLRAVAEGMLDERRPPHRAMATLLTAELSRRETLALDLPWPATPPIRRAAELLSEGPTLGLRALSVRVGLGGRTLERRFLAETGLSVAAWGRQARLHDSLRLLAGGASVKAAAQAAGYGSPSAFVAAFRTLFGATPGRYFGVQDGSTPAPAPARPRRCIETTATS